MASVATTVDLQSAPTTMSTASSTSSADTQPLKQAPLSKRVSTAAAAAVNGITVAAKHDPKTASIRQLTPADVPRAVNCLCAAFADDAVSRYFTHGMADTDAWSEARRWRLHMAIMKCVVKAHMMRGYVSVIGAPKPLTGPGSQRGCFVPADPRNPTAAESLDAVALWMPPNTNLDGLITNIRSGFLRLRLQLSKEGNQRFFGEFLPLLHDTKLSVLGSIEADAAAWYLVYLGTRAGAQGQGCAGRIVKAVTEGICDLEGRECYLESSHKRNLPIYKKMGFDFLKTIALIRDAEAGSVELEIMVRKPKGKETSTNDEKAENQEIAPVA